LEVVALTGKWRKPVFEGRHIELRLENDEVCIYATRVGLERIVSFCNDLLGHPKRGAGHIHLEDYELLTSASLKGVIALIPD
jgi:hypothetical protein